MANRIQQREDKLVADFGVIENPRERLAALVDFGARQPELAADGRTEENRVVGCVTEVWILLEQTSAGLCRARCAAGSPLVHGLVGAYGALYEDVDPAEAAGGEPRLLERLGLADHVTPTRLNGLAAVCEAIRSRAAELTGAL